MNMMGMRMRVELRVSCSNLLARDVLSPSDPVVVVRQRNALGKFEEIARTERIKNTNDPVFLQTIDVDYFFESVQTLKFAVYDIDNDSVTLDDDDGLGKYVTTLGQIVCAKEVTAELSKQNSSAAKPATITITATEITDSNVVEIRLRAEGLDKKDFIGKSDPYVQIFRRQEPDQWILVHNTEVIKDTRKPKWSPFHVRVQNLCNGFADKEIKIITLHYYQLTTKSKHLRYLTSLAFEVVNVILELVRDKSFCELIHQAHTSIIKEKFSCCDYDSNGKHDLIGECVTSLTEITNSNTELKFDLINPKKQAKKKDYKNSGKLTVSQCKILKRYSFLDYLFGGCQINFTCGIDFTGSNGDPRQSNSLHYLESANLNEYGQAIKAVGNVIQDYDSDKLFPAFGFGAKIPPSNEISHEFALNFNPQNPYCAGVDGVMQAYFNAVRTVKLWGPTNVAPIIHHVANFAEAAQQKATAENYFVLLLLTDGVVTDMAETIDAVVRASALPMSIIIVGVGNADFTAMEFLDGDRRTLKSSQGVKATRDIVQFVPFRKFKLSSVATLSSSVLAEIPKQVVDYFTMRELTPCAEAVSPSNEISSL